MDEPTADYQVRVIVIGNSTVGKTCLLRYFTEGRKPQNTTQQLPHSADGGARVYDPTVGVDFFSRYTTLDNGVRLKLQIWDTAGQDRFKSITQSYYRQSCGVVLVFDITNRSTFEAVSFWMDEARTYIDHPPPTFILVGSKCDDEQARQVASTEASEFAALHDMSYVECSAMTGLNVNRVFSQLGDAVHARIDSGLYQPDGRWDGIRICVDHSRVMSQYTSQDDDTDRCC